MLSEWQDVERVLVIQSGSCEEVVLIPALRSLRQSLPDAAITLMATSVSSQLTSKPLWVDDVLAYENTIFMSNREEMLALIEILSLRAFDAAVIFTNARESPYPLAYICYLAGIPIRLGQSDEFGGGLLSPWVKCQTANNQNRQHVLARIKLGSLSKASMRPLRILTWHVHGSYLYYLTQARHEFYLPVKPGRPEGYGGRLSGFPWSNNVHDVPAEEVRELTVGLYFVSIAEELPGGPARNPYRSAAKTSPDLPGTRPATGTANRHAPYCR